MEGQKAPAGRFVAAWPHHRARVLRHGHVGALAHGCVGTLVASLCATGRGQGQPPGHGTSCSRVMAAQEFGDRALSLTWFLEFLTAPRCRAYQGPAATLPHPPHPSAATPRHTQLSRVPRVASPEHGDPCPDSSLDSKCSVVGGEGSTKLWVTLCPPGLGGSSAHAGVVAVRAGAVRVGSRGTLDTCWDVRVHHPVWGQPLAQGGHKVSALQLCSPVQNSRDGGTLESAPDVSSWWESQARLVAMSSAPPSTSHGAWPGRGQPSMGEASTGPLSPCSPRAPD